MSCLSADSNQWFEQLAQGKRQCDTLADALQQSGYTVQSLRLVTNPFGEYLNTTNSDTATQGLASITQHLATLNQDSRMRIRFAIGEARTAHEISLLPALIKGYGDLCNACVNVATDEQGQLHNTMIEQAVQAIQQIAATTPNGEGNFNFTVNFNCDSYIPYFPAGYHRGERGNAVVLGLETPDLLLQSLQTLPTMTSSHADFMHRAYTAMQTALQYHVNQVLTTIEQTPLDSGWQFIGMDTSAAPSKDCASMVDVYRLLGVPYFGASGTVEASALLTKVFKSVQGVEKIGFSGLMLAVTEDLGLAQATQNGEFDIRALLTYSSICGIGLDTVPIPGDTPTEKVCAIMRDTGTMAYRLNKPLTVRLFPVPHLQAGEMTRFKSEDLCNCAILAVP